VAITIKKMKGRQPLFGTNMPGSASDRKVIGPIDKSPLEVQRNTDKLMKGTTTAGAGETAQEDASVNKQSKSQEPTLAALFKKGLRGEDRAGVSAEDARIKKGTAILQGKTDLKDLDGSENGQSPTYKDWRQTGGAKSNTIVAVSKKKAQQF
jgi:hypothetical protein